MFKRSNKSRARKLPQSYKRISWNFMTHLSFFDIPWHFPQVHAGQEEWIRVNFRTPQMFQGSTNVHWCTNGWHWLHLLRLSGFNLLFRLSQFTLHFLDAILGIPQWAVPCRMEIGLFIWPKLFLQHFVWGILLLNIEITKYKALTVLANLRSLNWVTTWPKAE